MTLYRLPIHWLSLLLSFFMFPYSHLLLCPTTPPHPSTQISLLITSSRLLWSKLLFTIYAFAPTSTPRSRSSRESRAVTNTMGKSASFLSLRIFAVKSSPFILGISTSDTTISNSLVRSCVNASTPSTAVLTSYPVASRTFFSSVRAVMESSTTRTDFLSASFSSKGGAAGFTATALDRTADFIRWGPLRIGTTFPVPHTVAPALFRRRGGCLPRH